MEFKTLTGEEHMREKVAIALDGMVETELWKAAFALLRRKEGEYRRAAKMKRFAATQDLISQASFLEARADEIDLMISEMLGAMSACGNKLVYDVVARTVQGKEETENVTDNSGAHQRVPVGGLGSSLSAKLANAAGKPNRGTGDSGWVQPVMPFVRESKG